MLTIEVKAPSSNPTIFEKLEMRQQVEDKMALALLNERLEANGMSKGEYELMPYSYRKSLITSAEDEAWHRVRQQPLNDWFVGHE